MAPVDVGSVEDLPEGVPTIVRVSDRDVALVRWRGEVFAVRNVCPHQTQSFAHGRTEKQVSGSGVPDQPLVLDEPVLACPWHTWKFNLRTGTCVADPTKRLRTYAVHLESGRVYVDVVERRPVAEDALAVR